MRRFFAIFSQFFHNFFTIFSHQPIARLTFLPATFLGTFSWKFSKRLQQVHTRPNLCVSACNFQEHCSSLLSAFLLFFGLMFSLVILKLMKVSLVFPPPVHASRVSSSFSSSLEDNFLSLDLLLFLSHCVQSIARLPFGDYCRAWHCPVVSLSQRFPYFLCWFRSACQKLHSNPNRWLSLLRNVVLVSFLSQFLTNSHVASFIRPNVWKHYAT